MASANLHIEYPTKSPRAKVLHTGASGATSLVRECRIRRKGGKLSQALV
ncbi:hypothetical protein M2283_001159 [Streptomyces pseudovenezuelae]|uniref:Uncharacterized protein n=1 Tax=Streptomyces pseudovenezuelae TaxID=67350 RepID=A0ABT6LC44_9ACTN|nr:hypothetical protein [Streptomyces pseudovenezuelae]